MRNCLNSDTSAPVFGLVLFLPPSTLIRLLRILSTLLRVAPSPPRSSASPVWFSFGSKLPCQLIPGSVDAAQPFAVHRTENEERRTALSVVGGNGSTTSTTLDRERARHARVKGGRQRRRRAVAAPAAAVGDHRRIPVRLLLDLFRCHHGDGHTTQAILAVDIQDQRRAVSSTR